VAISESRKKMFKALYGTKQRVSVIPNGIDPVRFFCFDSNTVRLIKEQRLLETEFLMVQPSRLDPRKNMELSIRVTKALRDLGVRARLLITGAHDPHEPKTMEYSRKLNGLSHELGVENHVLIMAEYYLESGERLEVDRIIMRDLYLIADILFLGMIKLPIVCSKIPPFVEIGADDVCTFDLHESPEKIAKIIIDLIGGLKSQRMFRKVINNYAWDNIYERKLMPVLANVIGTREEQIQARGLGNQP
jgi:glycosyltransferase involved in cell wall biosynthesis